MKKLLLIALIGLSGTARAESCPNSSPWGEIIGAFADTKASSIRHLLQGFLGFFPDDLPKFRLSDVHKFSVIITIQLQRKQNIFCGGGSGFRPK